MIQITYIDTLVHKTIQILVISITKLTTGVYIYDVSRDNKFDSLLLHNGAPNYRSKYFKLTSLSYVSANA